MAGISAKDGLSTRAGRSIAFFLRFLGKRVQSDLEFGDLGPKLFHLSAGGFRFAAPVRSTTADVSNLLLKPLEFDFELRMLLLPKVAAATAYLDGELCGIGDDGLAAVLQVFALGHGLKYISPSRSLPGGPVANNMRQGRLELFGVL